MIYGSQSASKGSRSSKPMELGYAFLRLFSHKIYLKRSVPGHLVPDVSQGHFSWLSLYHTTSVASIFDSDRFFERNFSVGQNRRREVFVLAFTSFSWNFPLNLCIFSDLAFWHGLSRFSRHAEVNISIFRYFSQYSEVNLLKLVKRKPLTSWRQGQECECDHLLVDW